MRKWIIGLWVIGFLYSCDPAQPKGSPKAEESQALDTLHLAFDWRPNVLHLGILEAERKGLFREIGIHLVWDTPEIDNYTRKPVKRLLAKEVDLAIGPSEHLLAFAADSNGVKAQAVATLLQADRSAFVVKEGTGISRPSEIGSATYLGYHTPLENEILAAMIEADGGEVLYEEREPGRLEVWPAFKKDSGEVAWVFLHWEALQARLDSISLKAFIPNDYGVPYGYSSVIMAPKGLNGKRAEVLKRFLKVLGRTYKGLEQDISYLDYEHPNFRDSIFIKEAYLDIRPYYLGSEKVWGRMDPTKWKAYADWLEERQLIDLKGYPVDSFYTNRYLSLN